MDWKMILGVTYWNALDLFWIVGSYYGLKLVFVQPLLDYLDLNKKSIR
tara:strand:- start:526 stop:669 length:144 start_codon:yes stop_codon:yes gene_type:complete